jgi:TonB dependent receptor
VTWYKQEGLGGSHEFQTGFLLMPRNYYKGSSIVTDPSGWTAESERLKDPNNMNSGTIPFSRTFVTSALQTVNTEGRDHDYGVYLQDTWRPIHRLTMTLGVRADFVQRYDILRSFEIEKSVEVAPRLGGALLLDDDAKNVLRASFARVHRQLMGGRDAVAAFSGNPTSSSKTTYDANGDGIFENEVLTPAVPPSVDSQRFDPDFHQPFVDELTTGYVRQLPLDMSVDVAYTHKTFRDSYAQTDINGFYPSAPGLPFGGFGKVDPRSGQILRLTNRTWARQQYNEVMLTVAKNMTNNFQAMASIQHQWQKEDGTWNPTDPAGFIQPDAFPNDRTIWRNQDPVDNNSLATGNTLRNTPTWTPGSFRVAATWNAPKNIVVSTSYTMVGGPWTGPILAQLAANHPDVLKYGPARFNGTTPVASGGQANPLATRIRFLNPTRSEGQEGLPYVRTLNFKFGYKLNMGGTRNAQLGLNIFNALNSGRYTEWHRSGANLSYDPNFYLVQDNQQTSRSMQFDVVFRF